MDDEYCVNKNKQPNGDHEVHNVTGGCNNLPNPENRKNLGCHVNCQNAVREGKKHYTQVNGCYYCCRECHTS